MTIEDQIRDEKLQYDINREAAKTNEYGNYFLNGFAKIRESYEPNDFYDVTYDFKDLRT